MTELRAIVAAKIMDTITEGFRGEQPPDAEVPADLDTARQAFIVALSMLIEADPRVVTRKDIREAADRTGREVRVQVHVLRDHHDLTGERA